MKQISGGLIQAESLTWGADKGFKGHKIESVCILSENKEQVQLALVADDDTVATILSRLLLKNKWNQL